jgi:AcrR family transcriptional regulator
MSIIDIPLAAIPGPRKRLSQEESRQAALEAASAILVEAGPQAVTLKAVSARIGRTHANLLHHFGSAAGLQRALAEHHAERICQKIGETVFAMRGGEVTPRDLVDLIFDTFDRSGGGALAAWMLLSGNEDALNPVMRAIHRLVDVVTDENHDIDHLRSLTLELVLLALGDSLMGGPLSTSLHLERSAGRDIATARLELSFAEWQKYKAEALSKR